MSDITPRIDNTYDEPVGTHRLSERKIGRDTVITVENFSMNGLLERISTLESQVKAKDAQLLELKPYLEALDKYRKLAPSDGYTIMDFQTLWLEQERDRLRGLDAKYQEIRQIMVDVADENKSLRSQLSKAREALREIAEQSHNSYPPGGVCCAEIAKKGLEECK